MCVMDIMNVLRTGMNMYISRIYVWLCNIKINKNKWINKIEALLEIESLTRVQI